MNPKYPIYIISKGRWDSRLTSKALERMKVPYHIVIEPQEYKYYSDVIDKKKILTLPFKNLGKGSIPARNWVWEHSIQNGHLKHWIMDDNIYDFYRLNRNVRNIVQTGTIFKICEDFTNRYENVPISGLNYRFFMVPTDSHPPYYLNTRVYSCILIDNTLKQRWRGRYNEDTDLCIRALKDGFCTFLFNAFLQEKAGTMSVKGGNTDELYADDGRLKMAKSLQEQHPDICTITWKFNRWQHQVNYTVFEKNKLIRKKNVEIKQGIDNYGLVLNTFDKI